MNLYRVINKLLVNSGVRADDMLDAPQRIGWLRALTHVELTEDGDQWLPIFQDNGGIALEIDAAAWQIAKDLGLLEITPFCRDLATFLVRAFRTGIPLEALGGFAQRHIERYRDYLYRRT